MSTTASVDACLPAGDGWYWYYMPGQGNGPFFVELERHGLLGRLDLVKVRPGQWRLTWTGPGGEAMTLAEGRQWRLEELAFAYVVQAQAAASVAALVLAS